MSTIRDAIEQAFERSGWSIKRLADVSDVPYASVYDFFNGKGLTLDNAQKLATALGIGRVQYEAAFLINALWSHKNMTKKQIAEKLGCTQRRVRDLACSVEPATAEEYVELLVLFDRAGLGEKFSAA